ncbi:MAG: hypothetical protein ING52_10725 [Burkholderiales bacterium]|nr:hypothetical protein [Burkholderiales bacterium]
MATLSESSLPSIDEVATAVAHCLSAHPPRDGIIPEPARPLVDLYAALLARPFATRPLQISAQQRRDLEQWSG